jgi:hypothetical protein
MGDVWTVEEFVGLGHRGPCWKSGPVPWHVLRHVMHHVESGTSSMTCGALRSGGPDHRLPAASAPCQVRVGMRTMLTLCVIVVALTTTFVAIHGVPRWDK